MKILTNSRTPAEPPTPLWSNLGFWSRRSEGFGSPVVLPLLRQHVHVASLSWRCCASGAEPLTEGSWAAVCRDEMLQQTPPSRWLYIAFVRPQHPRVTPAQCNHATCLEARPQHWHRRVRGIAGQLFYVVLKSVGGQS